jgi:membrane-bound lytic murein transglycosylase MltF
MFRVRLRGLFVCAGLLLSGESYAGSIFPSQFDGQIRSAAKTYLPFLSSWTLLKAQLYAESKLDPNTPRSKAGAEGIAQFLPGTWNDIAPHIGYAGMPSSLAGPAILGAAYYMAKLREGWPTWSDYELHKLALASYDAGIGNIKLATSQPACVGASSWAVVADCLPKVTGDKSKETLSYINTIWIYWQQIVFGL